jgi:hypothetical protein
LLKVVFLTIILCSALAGTLFFPLGKANPHMVIPYYSGDVAPDWTTEPPTVLIFSSENNTVYGSDDVSLSLNVSVGDSKTASWRFLENIYYETDWQSNKTSVYENIRYPQTTSFYPSGRVTTNFYPSSKTITDFSGTINLTGVPEVNHSIMVYAVESGYYYLYSKVDSTDNRNTFDYYNSFRITGSSFFTLSVDTTSPMVSVFSLENMTYYSPEVLLNFTVSEKCSSVVYSLDGQENVTIAGNTTLKNLPFGEHKITVYATDKAGHTGASETFYFSVEDPFPTMPFTAGVGMMVVIGTGFIYFKKRKH